jgi:hypothetical protein
MFKVFLDLPSNPIIHRVARRFHRIPQGLVKHAQRHRIAPHPAHHPGARHQGVHARLLRVRARGEELREERLRAAGVKIVKKGRERVRARQCEFEHGEGDAAGARTGTRGCGGKRGEVYTVGGENDGVDRVKDEGTEWVGGLDDGEGVRGGVPHIRRVGEGGV